MVSTAADAVGKRPGTADERPATARARPPGTRPPKAHPFLPRALHTQKALRVIRRTHSWLGMAGAAAAVIIGISGITLNHRAALNSRLPTDIASFQVNAPAGGFASQGEFEQFLQASLSLNGPPRERRGPAVRPPVAELGDRLVEQPRRFDAYYASAREVVEAEYVNGNRFIDVVQTERGFFSTLNRLHLASNTGPVWVAVIDAFSGALVVFSITGLLLWSRLTGPRLLAIGLAGSTLLATVYYAGVL